MSLVNGNNNDNESGVSEDVVEQGELKQKLKLVLIPHPNYLLPWS